MSTRLLLFALLAAFTAANAANPLLLVLEKDDRSLAIVDPLSMKILGRVDAGDDPHEIVASGDGKTAYISNYGAFSKPKHTLSVVDLVARRPLNKVDLEMVNVS